LEFTPQPDVKFGKITYPLAPPKKLPISDEPMAVYEGLVKIKTEVTAAPNLTAKEIVIKGRVRYQACDEKSCLPPVWQSFSVTIPVSRAEKPAVISSPAPESGKAPASVAAITAGQVEKPVPTDFDNKGIPALFLLVFLGGLALNLTPCVYPMIPITITYFGGQSQGKKGSLIVHSCLYVVGMAVTYSILGVVAAMTGGFLGAALQFPAVLIGIALVMGLLALSMFDVYEFRMPAALNRLVGSSQKGFAGSLLMGLTVGIAAAPCIGPFVLGLLTYVGNMGNLLLGFSLFFVLAIGLGVPFLALGIFSGNIRRLPRSGAWMIWVRKIFGFILLAMALYFLESLFPNRMTYYLTFALLMLLAGIYLAWIDPVESTGRAFPLIRNFTGIIFFAVALYAGLIGIQAGIGHSPASSGGSGSNGGIQWAPYTEAMLDRAHRESKSVFIDFYADWCVPCKELDAKTFSTPEVIDRSGEFIMLKVDLTSSDDAQSNALIEKYRIRGVPTLIFLQPDGREILPLRETGFVSKEVFLDKMNRALQLGAEHKPAA
jgi:thiol:disulfide interchange protein DsbD